jgi:DNA-binding transcriptional regulator YdaS (Cro superfamily)
MQLHDWLDVRKGQASALADHLRVSKTAVSLWRISGVPMVHMPAVVEFTEGAVTVEEMAHHAIECRVKAAAAREAEQGPPAEQKAAA